MMRGVAGGPNAFGPLPAIDVMRPNVPALKFVSGLPQLNVLSRLNTSTRSSRFCVDANETRRDEKDASRKLDEAAFLGCWRPWQHLLYELTGRRWGNIDVENETGCGIVPYVYKKSSVANAVQWAVGL